MERLTKRDESGCLNYPWEFNGVNGSYDILDEDLLAKQIDRLAAYEDTGLEPDVCADYRKFEDEAVSKGVPFKRIVELMNAEQDGRLVVLPSKTVWELTMDAGPDCDMKCPIDVWEEALGCDSCSKATQFAYERPCTQERLKELGKTVFLTREAADAALSGKGGEEHRENRTD